MKRFAAVITLAVLSPLIAEYLSGSMSFAQIGAMPVLLAMYGGGVVLIRELVRRTGRGWPSILLLGLTYALIEEGIADQSLFNPNFMGLHQLASGYIPELGIGVPATIFAFGIHVIWSIAVPIAVAESLFSSIRNEPWTGRIGLAVAALFYVAGVALVAWFFARKFMASPAQLGRQRPGPSHSRQSPSLCRARDQRLPAPRRVHGWRELWASSQLAPSCSSTVSACGMAPGNLLRAAWPWRWSCCSVLHTGQGAVRAGRRCTPTRWPPVRC